METTIMELYKTFNVLPIPLLHEMQMLIFVHKCLYHSSELPMIFKDYFVENSSIHGHFTRFNSDLFVKNVHSNFGQRCSKFCGSKLWNALPMSIKTNSSLFIFKKETKMYLMCKD